MIKLKKKMRFSQEFLLVIFSSIMTIVTLNIKVVSSGTVRKIENIFSGDTEDIIQSVDVSPGRLVYFDEDPSGAFPVKLGQLFQSIEQHRHCFNKQENFQSEISDDDEYDNQRQSVMSQRAPENYQSKLNEKNEAEEDSCAKTCPYVPDDQSCPTDEDNQIVPKDEGGDDNVIAGTSQLASPFQFPQVLVWNTTQNGWTLIQLAIPAQFQSFSSAPSSFQGFERDKEEKSQTLYMRRIASARRRNRRNRQPKMSALRNAPAKEVFSTRQNQALPTTRRDRVVERGPHKGGDVETEPALTMPESPSMSVYTFWPGGRVPYHVNATFNKCQDDVIFEAIDEIEARTCIQFVERTDEEDYVVIQSVASGCTSKVGMRGGAQDLKLAKGCFNKFTVTHELLHAVGFDHEMSRDDRNEFVILYEENIQQGKEDQFEQTPGYDGFGLPYDIRSVMHYSAFAFGIDKCSPTISPQDDSIDICELGIGDGKGGMTKCDEAKVNAMYNCGGDYVDTCETDDIMVKRNTRRFAHRFIRQY